VTHRDSLDHITEWTGCGVTTKGTYVLPGRKPGPGERKLYLEVEGPTEIKVQQAKAEILRTLDEVTREVGAGEAERYGKYTV
jgi:ATP-dependent RNA helicase DDX46/PRP5